MKIVSTSMIALSLATAFSLQSTSVFAQDNTDSAQAIYSGDGTSTAWTGFFAGGFVGAGGRVTNVGLGGFADVDGLGGEGLLGGAMVGYNYQVNSDFVVGIQGDIAWTGMDTELNPGLLPISGSFGTDYIASISARAGVIVNPDTMLYALGGFSFAKSNFKLAVPIVGAVSLNEDYTGAHVGAGLETRVTDNLTARVEYRYTAFDGENYGNAGLARTSPSAHTATVGLAWNWYDPNSTQVSEAVSYAQTDWTGLYLGGFVGAGASVTDLKLLGGNFNGLGGEGFAAGAMVGYNYQVAPEFVLGLQADLTLTDLDNELNVGLLGISASSGSDFVGSASVRAGWLATPDTLLYVLGGFSRAESSFQLNTPIGTGEIKQSFRGYHVGGGLETRVSERVTARMEYRYTEFGEEDSGTLGFLNFEPSMHTATFGFAYNWYEPNTGAVQTNGYGSYSDWTGIYAGGYIGAGGRVTSAKLGPIGFNGIGGDGFLGGLLLGYNYQLTSDFVLGLQGDYAFTDMDTSLGIAGLGGISANVGYENIWSISGRAGWLNTPDTMIYLLGGFSSAESDFAVNTVIGGLRQSQTLAGYHAGTGIETKISDNLTARIEYRYTDFRSTSWGTGGLLNFEPSAHSTKIGLAWNWFSADGMMTSREDDLETADWTGAFVGAMLGAGAKNTKLTAAGFSFDGIGGEGILGGIMVGYDHQVSDEFVLGVQADYSLTDLDTELSGGILPINVTIGTDYVASLSARAGWLASADTMIYLMGGYSWGNTQLSLNALGLGFSLSDKLNGFHAGTGIETKLTENLSTRIEYRYTDFNSADWGTGGFINFQPTTHTTSLALTWKW